MTVAIHPGFSFNLPEAKGSSEDRFLDLCRANPDYRLERSATGEIFMMPPTDAETGRRNLQLAVQLGVWARSDGMGEAFDSSTGFKLPNGATRSPDLAWIRRSRLQSAEEGKGFLKICPDFVLELRSRSDRMPRLKTKMREYIANEAELGWLIDPLKKAVYIFRPGQPVKKLVNPRRITGEPVLRGFQVDLQPIWKTLRECS